MFIDIGFLQVDDTLPPVNVQRRLKVVPHHIHTHTHAQPLQRTPLVCVCVCVSPPTERFERLAHFRIGLFTTLMLH